MTRAFSRTHDYNNLKQKQMSKKLILILGSLLVLTTGINAQQACEDNSNGYVLRLNPTDFPVGSNHRIAFTKAVADWRCMTGANLTIGADTNITSNPIS